MGERAIRIAMWSGPRNISTALLRAWGSRADTVVWDEPLYAHYLLETGIGHPGRDEILARHETDWRKVVRRLADDELPAGKTILYQKHMAHHLLPHVDRGWLERVRNAFLIREPAEMLASLVRITPEPRIEDTGLPQQLEIFDRVRGAQGEAPPVVDAKDVLRDPRGVLSRLCDALGVPFREAMLSWSVGPRETDGAWAKHWYAGVEASTGFQPYSPKPVRLPERLRRLREECEVYYGELHARRLTT